MLSVVCLCACVNLMHVLYYGLKGIYLVLKRYCGRAEYKLKAKYKWLRSDDDILFERFNYADGIFKEPEWKKYLPGGECYRRSH